MSYLLKKKYFDLVGIGALNKSSKSLGFESFNDIYRCHKQD